MADEDVRRLYANHPINLRANETRLVTIQPGGFHQPIFCVLTVIALSEDIPEALSYACGYPCEKCYITVAGVQFLVTTRLEAALRQLRRVDCPRTLWIDAISIHQKSDSELNHQVARMNQVYGRAAKVTVWLEPTPVASRAFATLSALGDDIAAHWDPKVKPNVAAITEDTLLDCTSLLSMLWFGRVWTVQEAVLAKYLEVICGESKLDGSKLWKAVDSFFRHGNADCCSQYMTLITQSVKDARTAFGSLYDVVRYQRLLRANQELDYAKLLFDFSYRGTWREHDRIYGMLGLAQGKYAQLVNPNYACKFQDMYQDTTFQLLKRSQSLDSLTLLTEKHSSLEYPSWVHDWNRQTESPERILRDNRLRALRLSAPLIAACEYETLRHGMLKLLGRRIATVKHITESAVPASWQDPRAISNIFESWKAMLIHHWTLIRPLLGSKVDVNVLFAQLLSASCLRQQDSNGEVVFVVRPAQALADCQPSWLKWLHDGRPTNFHIPLQLKQYNNAVHVATMQRKLVITDRGHVVLAPECVRVGDEITALAGGRCPYVLRRSTDLASDSRSNTPRYALLGDCFLQDATQIVATSSTLSGLQEFVLI